jgi:hypothetical protein
VEVAEAKAKKAELLQRLEELDKQKKIALAEMELNKEEEDMEEEQTAVRHLKDLRDDESKEVVPIPKDDGLEDFPMDKDEPLTFLDDEDESLDTEDDDLKPESVKTKPVIVWAVKPSFITNQEQETKEKKKKAMRGKTRAAVEAEKTRLRQEQQNLKHPAEDNEDNKM